MTEVDRSMRYIDALDEDDRVAGFLRHRLTCTSSEQPFLVGSRRSTTYGELGSTIEKLHGSIVEAGLTAGDRTLLITTDDHAFAAAFLGLFASGVTAVPLDPAAPDEELLALVRAADARAVVADPDVLERIGRAGLLEPMRLIVSVGGPRPAGAKPYPTANGTPASPHPPAMAIPYDATALMLFTSGTTSKPKGVELTFRNVLSHIDTLIRVYGLDDATRLLNPIGLNHTDGCLHGAMLIFACGGTLFRPGPVTLPTLFDVFATVRNANLTHMIVTPTSLYLLNAFHEDIADYFRGDAFTFAVSTGAYLDEKLWREFEERFATTIVNVYGLTETAIASFYCGPTPETRRIGTIGKPIDCDARIVDAERRDVAPGEAGELWLRGQHIMKGYFHDIEATAEVLREGWLATGDIVTVDADGFYRIVGRKKNVIIVGGSNVYAEDVTNVIRKMHGVADALTIGVPDDAMGERVVACVQLAAGAHLDANTIIDHCRMHMAPYKIPRAVKFFPEFPRGPVGKILIGKVRENVLADLSDG